MFNSQPIGSVAQPQQSLSVRDGASTATGSKKMAKAKVPKGSIPGALRKIPAQNMKDNRLVITRYIDLADELRGDIRSILGEHGIEIAANDSMKEADVVIPQFGTDGQDMAKLLGKTINSKVNTKKPKKVKEFTKTFSEPIDWLKTKRIATDFSGFLKENKEELAEILMTSECYNVAIDEIDRSIDLLDNIDSNKDYFSKKVNLSAASLPLNQPLYATVCFGLIPALMSKRSITRPPTANHNLFRKLDDFLNLSERFSGFEYSFDSREDFIKSVKDECDVFVYTGTFANGKKINKQLNKECLFVLNGAGHNPVVVTPEADLDKAAKSIASLCFQNQGQDCAAPNSILIHEDIKGVILEKISRLFQDAENRSGKFDNKANIIGNNTRVEDSLKHAKRVFDNREFLVAGGDVNPATGLIKPVMFVKPLEKGGNYEEFFAPVIMLQTYKDDQELLGYFKKSDYKRNAMYATFFGKSSVGEHLIESGLHTEENILINTDLHIEEHGYLPYGGKGVEASCLIFQGNVIPGATLPQRDIYERLINR